MKKREKKNLKILVTGGAGFIGAHLSNSLIASGHKVLICLLYTSDAADE